MVALESAEWKSREGLPSMKFLLRPFQIYFGAFGNCWWQKDSSCAVKNRKTAWICRLLNMTYYYLCLYLSHSCMSESIRFRMVGPSKDNTPNKKQANSATVYSKKNLLKTNIYSADFKWHLKAFPSILNPCMRWADCQIGRVHIFGTYRIDLFATSNTAND